jgi:hypothetical protein
LYQKKIPPPFMPEVQKGKLDISQIDPVFIEEVPSLTMTGENDLAPVHQQDFEGFTYQPPSYLASR